MPATRQFMRLAIVVTAAWLASAALTGCAAGRSNTTMTMFGCSASPSANTPANAATADADVEAPAAIELLPTFAATCRPDFRIERVELALVFVDTQPAHRFELLPMFGATCSPGGRPSAPRLLDLDATIVGAPAYRPVDRAVSAEPEAP